MPGGAAATTAAVAPVIAAPRVPSGVPRWPGTVLPTTEPVPTMRKSPLFHLADVIVTRSVAWSVVLVIIAESALAPAAFLAATENWYVTPGVSPVTVCLATDVTGGWVASLTPRPSYAVTW